MKKIIIAALTFGLLAAFGGCQNDYVKPLENDEEAPSPVRDVAYIKQPGAVLLTYTLPSDPDLLYVAARYTNKEGKKYEFKSSYFTNTLLVEGFGDTDTYSVDVYAVDRSENYSTPVNLQVNADTPPVQAAYESLEVQPDFGGMTFTFANEAKADLTVYVSTTNADNEMVNAETFYTGLAKATFSVRGYLDTPRDFEICFEDKWGNRSQVKKENLTPIYETELDKKKFREVILPGDFPCTFYESKMEYIWDGRAAADGDGQAGAHTGIEEHNGPTWFTFDLGVLAKLSRFNLKFVQDDKHFYNDVSPRIYEIWGCAELDKSGSWDSWTMLLHIENEKPSGLPGSELTEDDRLAAREGDNANFPLDASPVRYIRIKCIDNWTGNSNMVFTEVTFWGDDKSNE